MKNIFLIATLFLFASIAHADNLGVTEGSGEVVGTDEISAVHYPRHKIVLGTDGVNSGDLSTTNRMPIRTDRTDGFSGTNTTDITNTTSTEIVAGGSGGGGGGGGARHFVETWIVSNSHATVGTVVQLLDGSTVKAQCPAAPNYGGCVVNFPTPIRGSTDTAWNCKNVTTGAAVRCTVTGVTISN